MNAFSTSTTAYQLTNKLSTLRRNNPAARLRRDAAALDEQRRVHIRAQVLRLVVLVAINKNETTAYNITGLNTSLPAGSYSDYLTNLLGGSSITVSSGTGGNNPVAAFSLPAHTVAVWQFVEPPRRRRSAPSAPRPRIRACASPSAARTSARLRGRATSSSARRPPQSTRGRTRKSSPRCPRSRHGNSNVTVTKNGGTVSNGIQMTVLTARLIPVTFTVFNASPTTTGDYIFLTGSTVELGNWATTWDGAVGPMMPPSYPNWFLNVSVPAGQTIQFKFIKIAVGRRGHVGGGREPQLHRSHLGHGLRQRQLAVLIRVS